MKSRDGNRIENRIASHVFLGKISHQNNQKNRIRYRIAEFDKKICDFFDYFDFFVFNSISFFCLVRS